MQGGAALVMGALGPFVTIPRILEPPQQLSRPEPFPGQHSPHYPVHLRPRDPGHLFPPSPLYYNDDWLDRAPEHPLLATSHSHLSFAALRSAMKFPLMSYPIG